MASKFESDTKEALLKCAKWLEENAESLASDFNGGCKSWSVEFGAGDDGIFDYAMVTTSSRKAEVIGGYRYESL